MYVLSVNLKTTVDDAEAGKRVFLFYLSVLCLMCEKKSLE